VPGGGYTLFEMVIVVLVITMISVVLNGTIAATQDADNFLSAMRSSAQRGQRIALEVSTLVGSSRKLFTGDEVGEDYLAALDLDDLPVALGARLPVAEEDAVLDEDAEDAPMTGNVLLFAREADAATCVANATSGTLRQIDTMRFVCIYPHVTSQTIAAHSGPARDLVIWRSVLYPSWTQIQEIPDATQRKSVLKDLYVRYGCREAWNPDAGVDAAFYRIDKDGNLALTPVPGMTIPEDENVSDRGRLVYARSQLAPTDENSFAKQGVLTADDETWQPEGFEVKVTGLDHTRKLWIHLVTESPQAGGARRAVMPFTVIATCQDM